MINFQKVLMTVCLILCFDYIYLTLSSKYYKKQIKHVQGRDMSLKYIGIILTYLLMVYAHFYLSDKNPFIIGGIIYGVFNLTNYSIFCEWTMRTVIQDTLWGMLLFGSSSEIIKNIYTT